MRCKESFEREWIEALDRASRHLAESWRGSRTNGERGYVQFVVRAIVTYQLVVDTQRKATSLLNPFMERVATKKKGRKR